MRPQPVNRVANAALGLAVAVFGGALLIQGAGGKCAGGLLVPIGIYVAYRGYRLAIETRSDSATVWGQFRTVRIPRSNVQRITDLPAIVWTSEAVDARHGLHDCATHSPIRREPPP